MEGAKEIKWDDVLNSEFVAGLQLSNEEEAAVKERLDAMKKVFEASEVKASYKIDIEFKARHDKMGVTKGVMTFWENGRYLTGRGDAKLYLCADVKCRAPVPGVFEGGGQYVCPKCKQAFPAHEMAGELIFGLTMQNWAIALHKVFKALDMDADIYIKCNDEDIRIATDIEMHADKGGELLDRARVYRRWMYPLQRIVKDTSSGADLLKLFYACLTA